MWKPLPLVDCGRQELSGKRCRREYVEQGHLPLHKFEGVGDYVTRPRGQPCTVSVLQTGVQGSGCNKRLLCPEERVAHGEVAFLTRMPESGTIRVGAEICYRSCQMLSKIFLTILMMISPVWAGVYSVRIPKPPTEPSTKIERFAHAIARAEGFYRKGTIPNRYHN